MNAGLDCVECAAAVTQLPGDVVDGQTALDS